jgi:hypothetical protein
MKPVEIYNSDKEWPHGVLDELPLDKVDLYLSTLYFVADYFFDNVRMEVNRIDKTFQLIIGSDIGEYTSEYCNIFFNNFHKLLNAYFKLYDKKAEEEIIGEASIANADVDDESDEDYYYWHQTYVHLADIYTWYLTKNNVSGSADSLKNYVPEKIKGKDEEEKIIGKLLEWMM